MSPKIEALSEVARAVTLEVLETMFFETAEPVECRHQSCTGNCLGAKVRFEGSPHGELRVMLSRELAGPIACGFLGIDPQEVTAEEEKQIACELANMICGAILSRLHPDARVALAAPEIIEIASGENGGTHQCFATPEGMLAVTMVAEP